MRQRCARHVVGDAQEASHIELLRSACRCRKVAAHFCATCGLIARMSLPQNRDALLRDMRLDCTHVVAAKPLHTFARHASVAAGHSAALAALTSLARLACWGRGGVAAGLLGGAAGKREECHGDCDDQVSWGHGFLPWSRERSYSAARLMRRGKVTVAL